MAIRMFCDRCRADITEVQSTHIGGCDCSDERGCGTITHEFDLCVSCYKAAIAWLKTHAAPGQ